VITYTLTGTGPYTGGTITVNVGTAISVKLGFFFVLIKRQLTIVYIDFIYLSTFN